MKKKKKIEDIPCCGGLLIGESISLDVSGKGISLERLKLWVVALFGIFGTIFGVVSLFDIRCDDAQLSVLALASFLISSIVFSSKKYAFPSLVLIVLMVLGFFALPQDELDYGFKCFVNCIVEQASLESYDISGFYVPRKISEYECLTVFMSVFSVLTSFLVCFSVLARKSFPLSFVFTFPLIEVGLFFGIAPDYKCFAMLLSFWLAMVVLSNSNYREYVGSSGSDFVRKGNSFMPKFGMKKRVDCSSALCMLVITLAVFSVSGFALDVFDIKRPDSVNELRYTLKHDITNMSFEDIVDKLSGETGKSNYGNLRSGDLEYTDSDMLYVKFENKMNTNVYLKSYVGSVYDSSSWEEFEEDTIDELSEIESEFEDICYPQNMLWYFMRSNYADLPKTSVTVDVINAQTDFCYTPYGSEPKRNAEYVDDSVALVDSVVIGDNDAKASYSYDFIPSNFEMVIEWHCDNENNKNTLYLDTEQYDSFVEKNYLSLPDDDDLMSLYEDEEYAEIFENYRSGKANVYQTLCAIRSLIHDNARYTLSPGEAPDDVDVVYYFLKENHKGYCMHYASAGAVLARMAGIPARYCVGYVASSSKFNLLNKEGSGYEFMLKDDAAHAWAEIYIDGLGWVPFEFTEGYSQPSQTTTTTSSTVTTTRRTTALSGTSVSAASTTSTTTTAPLASLSQEPRENGPLKTIILILVVLAILALLTVIIIMRSRKVALLRRKKSMSTQSGAENAVNAYRYIVSLLEFGGIAADGRTPLEYAGLAESKCDFLENGQLVSACNCAMKAGFGSMYLNKDESEKVCKLSHRIAKAVYDSKSCIDKLKMKYIERLI
ncbi:MAG: transglutaminase domain-containing protein [Oscillospiraceae bacterium]|nr:transglutaminase domain-containing protein [Oscillospiraceae bacterium]